MAPSCRWTAGSWPRTGSRASDRAVSDLTFRPRTHTRVAFVLLFLGLAAMFLAGLKDIPPRGLGDYFAIAIALACIYAAITYPMRAVQFTGDTVRVQTMGRWTTT